MIFSSISLSITTSNFVSGKKRKLRQKLAFLIPFLFVWTNDSWIWRLTVVSVAVTLRVNGRCMGNGIQLCDHFREWDVITEGNSSICRWQPLFSLQTRLLTDKSFSKFMYLFICVTFCITFFLTLLFFFFWKINRERKNGTKQ